MSTVTAALLTALSAQWAAVMIAWINHRTVAPVLNDPLGHSPTRESQQAAAAAGP